MKRKPDAVLVMSTFPPTYDEATKVVQQTIEVRCKQHRLTSEMIAHAVDKASDVFAGIMKLNELDDFKWPPEAVDVNAHADMRGAVITFQTRARRGKPAVFVQ